ncbi:hypothetical protein L596_001590 [Steinernema carpocapsae]|uniref:Sema domain-containing protein n=1 Tax=Steinernema carpocapsae TaxID=34508 RepID=A0A4U8ULW8_STECR|nr:hypothetical protein L596_001590 [Steinernema carpocapsae]
MNFLSRLSVVLLLCFVDSSSAASFSELFGTDQYALIGVSGCNVTLETKLPQGSCPSHFTDEIEPSKERCVWKSLTLLSDSSNSSLTLPQILAFGSVGEKRVVLLKSLDYPDRIVDGKKMTTTVMTENSVNVPQLEGLDPVNVLYDSESRILYVISKSDKSTFIINSYAVLSRPRANLRLRHVYTLPIFEEFARLQWFSDPYKQKFYFYDKSQYGDIQIRSIRFTDFIRSVTVPKQSTDALGILDEILSEDRFTISVTGGVVFSAEYAAVNSYHIKSLQESCESIKCDFHENTVVEQVFLVENWDYCKLRDGHKADYETCQKERKIFSKEEKISSDTASTLLKIVALLVAILTIGVIISLIITLIRFQKNLQRMKESTHNLTISSTIHA